jgi:NAD(P)-dependent dehydrogenase (short-subunit alcohol dehydrogenase family)
MTESNLRRVALITGAGQGIGKGIALRLADDGLDIAINDIASKEAELAIVAEDIRSKGRRVYVATADVSEEDQVKTMIDNVVKELGGLDVVSAFNALTNETKRILWISRWSPTPGFFFGNLFWKVRKSLCSDLLLRLLV